MQFIKKLPSYFFILCILVLCLFSGTFFWLSTHEWLDLTADHQEYQSYPSVVLDDQGQELFRFALNRRTPIIFKDIPDHVIKAFIATEDHAFFDHSGISIKGIMRSIAVNILKRRVVQGASTITQQLVKLLYTDGSRTFKRKIKEQFLALILENKYSKEQIFQSYVNHLYFGCGIYGIRAAAHAFWDKKIEDITVDEAATLACIVRSPATYCPLICPENACKGRNIVLDCMVRQGFITPKMGIQLKSKPVQLAVRQPAFVALRELLRQQLESLVGKNELYTQGFVIYTTIDRHAQEKTEQLFKKSIALLRTSLRQQIDGAVISLEGATGAIKTIITGYDFKESQFNRTKARRQMGSTFKPLVYTAAIEHGITLSDVAIDEPLEIQTPQGTWSPRNVYRRFDGPMTLAHALSRSNNIIAIKTLMRVGFESVLELAQKCHLTPPLYGYPALALGCLDCTPLQVVSMFNIFAQRGTYVEPYLIASIKDRFDNKVFKHTVTPEQVISWATATQINSVLQISMSNIQNRVPDLLSTQAIGKSGTATQATTCWFTGATPERTTVIYIGRDDNQSMGTNVYAMRTALPLWLEINKQIPCSQKEFLQDPTVEWKTINPLTGKNSNEGIKIATK